MSQKENKSDVKKIPAKSKRAGTALAGAPAKDEELCRRIQRLRIEAVATPAEFAKRFDVNRVTFINWENGNVPPTARVLIEMGNMAKDRDDKLFFWRRAGIETAEIEEVVQEEFLARREKSVGDDVCSVPIWSVANLKAGGGISQRSVAFPATRVSNPRSTFCLEVTAESRLLPGFLDQGDLAVIDSSQKEFSEANLTAVYFAALPNLELADSTERLKPARDLRRVRDVTAEQLKAFFERSDEPTRPPGVRFGWFSLIDASQWLGTMTSGSTLQNSPWCYALRAPALSGIGGRSTVLLSDWNNGPLPILSLKNVETLLRSEVHILGTVIGWIAAREHAAQRRASLEKKV
jgi:DNA-binding XRE family transcriptional regulator